MYYLEGLAGQFGQGIFSYDVIPVLSSSAALELR